MLKPPCNSVLGRKFGSKGAILLFETLRDYNVSITFTNIADCKLDDECIPSLGMFIGKCTYIESVILVNISITSEGIRVLADYIIGSITLQLLDIQNLYNLKEAYLPSLIEIAKGTRIKLFRQYILGLPWSPSWKRELKKYLDIPADQREIPVKSKIKSAAKR